MSALPLQPVFPYLVDELQAAIALATSSDASDPRWATRDAVATAVILLPATCRDARALAKLDERRWAWLCAFEIFRTNSGAHLRLFDGFPSCIDDFRLSPGARPVGPAHPEDQHLGAFADSARECHLLWTEFARWASTWDALRDGGSGGPADGRAEGLRATDGLPANLPVRVRAFAGYVRWTWQRTLVHDDPLSSASSHSDNRACSRRGCTREAHPIFERCLALSQGVMRVESGNDPDAQQKIENVYAYWKNVKAMVDMANTSDASMNNRLHILGQRFCSTTCAHQVWDEYDRCVRCATFEGLDTPLPASRSARPPNAARLYTAALDRNARIARLMRACPLEGSRTGNRSLAHWPGEFDPQTERERWVHALNLDTALLYAATTIGELPQARRSQRAVPKRADWRELGGVWLNALNRVHRIMMNRGASAWLASNRFSLPGWFAAVKDRALTIF